MAFEFTSLYGSFVRSCYRCGCADFSLSLLPFAQITFPNLIWRKWKAFIIFWWNIITGEPRINRQPARWVTITIPTFDRTMGRVTVTASERWSISNTRLKSLSLNPSPPSHSLSLSAPVPQLGSGRREKRTKGTPNDYFIYFTTFRSNFQFRLIQIHLIKCSVLRLHGILYRIEAPTRVCTLSHTHTDG